VKIEKLICFIFIFVIAFPLMSCSDDKGVSRVPEEPLSEIQWYAVAPPVRITDNSKVILPAARDYFAPGGVPLRVLFNHWVRDPYILNAPDGYYYMVGTADKTTLPEPLVSSDNSNGWWYNDGIPLWRSKDLVDWETMGYVWTFDDHATWAKEYKFSPNTQTEDNSKVRAIWAPEIHYIKGNYWLVYSMNYNGIGILKSTTGRPEGPYTDINPEGPLPGNIDVSLFEDTDGTVYYMTDGYNIARMKDDMSGLAEELRKLDFKPSPPWAEGITMMKINDTYVYLGAANTTVTINGREERTYDCFSATSNSVYGPYEDRYRAITYAGHNNIFEDNEGNLWSTQFHPQPHMQKAIEPALIPVQIDDNGYISIKKTSPNPLWKYTTTIPQDGWLQVAFDDNEWLEGTAAFGDPEIHNTGAFTDVGTRWTEKHIWMRKKFDVNGEPSNPALFIRARGRVEVYINGTQVYKKNASPEEYETIAVDAGVFRNGENIIAVTMEGRSRLPYIDVGVVDIVR